MISRPIYFGNNPQNSPAMLRWLCAVLWMSLLGMGCTPSVESDAASAAAGAPYEPVLEMHDLMASVLDPATDVIWGAAGTVITEDGEQDLSPTDDDGWQVVFNAAAVVAESGNLLMLPGRAKDDGDWMEYSAALISTGQEAMAAAEAKDADAVFDVGGKLYLICVACHQTYDTEMDDHEMDGES